MIADALAALQGDEVTNAQFLDWVAEHLREHRKIYPMQEDSWIRASSVGRICAREEVLCAREGVVRTRTQEASLSWIFGVGHAIHSALQNQILGPAGLIVGEWRCKNCGAHQGGWADFELVPYPDDCPHCEGGEGFEYIEMLLKDEDLRLRGHNDGFHPNGKDLWEFKSANQHAMRSIKKGFFPFGYEEQAQTYLHLSGRDRIRMLFVDKNETNIKRAWHLKVFPKRKKVFTQVRKRILSLREGLGGGKLPKRICADKSCARAMDCAVRKQCFGA